MSGLINSRYTCSLVSMGRSKNPTVVSVVLKLDLGMAGLGDLSRGLSCCGKKGHLRFCNFLPELKWYNNNDVRLYRIRDLMLR